MSLAEVIVFELSLQPAAWPTVRSALGLGLGLELGWPGLGFGLVELSLSGLGCHRARVPQSYGCGTRLRPPAGSLRIVASSATRFIMFSRFSRSPCAAEG